MLGYILYVLGSVGWWCGGRGEDEVAPSALRAAVLGELLTREMESLALLLLRPLGCIVLLLGGACIGGEEYYASEWTEEEKSEGLHLPGQKVAENCRSERGRRNLILATSATPPTNTPQHA